MEQHTTLWAAGYMRVLAAVLLAMGIFALGAYGYATLKQSKYFYSGPVTINVQGEGKVMAKPDIGSFSFSVRAEGDDAASAQAAAAEKSNAVLAYLKGAGVDEKDIATENYNLNEQWRYEENVCASNSYCPPGERVADGFEVYQRMTVKVRDLEQSGALVAGVGGAGATDISSLSFTIDDPEILKGEAREAAIADAVAKAEVLADNLDVRIVKMTSFYEETGGYYPEYYAREAAYDMVANEMASAPELPTGEDEYTVRVNISYEVR